jgi:hypothetical protein
MIFDNLAILVEQDPFEASDAGTDGGETGSEAAVNEERDTPGPR